MNYFMLPLHLLQSFILGCDTAEKPERKRLSTFAEMVPVVHHGKGVYPLSERPLDESSSMSSSDEVTTEKGYSDDSFRDQETAASDFSILDTVIDPQDSIDTSAPIEELVDGSVQELNFLSHWRETEYDRTDASYKAEDNTPSEYSLDRQLSRFFQDDYSYSSSSDNENDRIFQNEYSYSSFSDNEDDRASSAQNGRQNIPGYWNRDRYTCGNVVIEAEEPSNNTTWNPCPGAERKTMKRHEELPDGSLRQEFLQNQHANVRHPWIPCPRKDPLPLWFPYDLQLTARGNYNDSADEDSEMNLMDVAIPIWQTGPV